MAWRANFPSTPEDLDGLLATVRTVAVLGIKTETQADQPAFYVPAYLVNAGLEVFPVPVYYPEVTDILGRPVYRRLADIPGPVDLVDVFRRPAHVPGHFDALLAKRPRAVWLQSGIRHDATAGTAAASGTTVRPVACANRRNARNAVTIALADQPLLPWQ